MIDALLAETFDHTMAALYLRERPRTDNGLPDHDFRVVSILRQATPSARSLSTTRCSTPDLVRSAIKEFLESGGRRPVSVEWRAWSVDNV